MASSQPLIDSPGVRQVPGLLDVTDLLQTKIGPPRLPSTFVNRSRVLRTFEAAATKALTVVSAGPGWGKTLAAAAWAADCPPSANIAWLSLDAADSSPGLFWSYVLAALRRTDGIPADNPLMELAPARVFDETAMRRLVYGLSKLPHPVTLVLDDFHEIYDRTVLGAIEALLRHPVPQLRLMLITRVDPTISLYRLRLSGDYCEIRAADLGFSAEETAAFFGQYGLHIGASLHAVLDWTEGWPAGLRLTALALQADSTPAQLESLAGSDRIVADYLADEVLAAQPPDLRKFLLHTSVTNNLTGDIADILTGGHRGQEQLDQLERANAFVTRIGTAGQWYRYHPMFRDMLQRKLATQEPDTVPLLHRRAARWFAIHNNHVEAVRHAVSAADWALLARLLVTRVGPRVLSVEREALGRLLEQVPDADGEADDDSLHLCRAAKTFVNNHYAATTVHVARAWQSLPQMEPDIQSATRVALHLFGAFQARLSGEAASLTEHTALALELLNADAATTPAAEEYGAIARSNHGVGLFWSGRYEEAERYLTAAKDGADTHNLEVAKINALGHLAVAAATAGRLREAERHAGAAVDLANLRGWNRLVQVSAAYLALALVHLHRNELEEADRLVQLGLAVNATGGDRLTLAALQVTEVRISATRGQLTLAAEAVAALRRDTAARQLPELLARWLVIVQAEVDLGRGDAARAIQGMAVRNGWTPTTDYERVCLARGLLLSGQPYEAEQVVAPLRDGAFDRAAEVESWLITALVADHRREDHRAAAAMDRGIALAREERFLRPFTLFDRQKLARVLSKAVGRGATPSDAYDLFLDALDTKEQASSGRAEHLTDRELTVLKFLPSLLSNVEIAAEIYVSVNTVKAHLKSLYRKLEVSSRREAVSRARQLNLL